MPYKIPFLLTGFLLVATSFFHLSAHEENSVAFESFTGKVTGSKVRMRTQPNLDAHVVREITNSEMFGVIDQENDFYAVSPPKGMKGYVFRTFVLDGVVEGERVNIRLYPDIDAPVIAQLNTGDKIQATVCESHNKWLEVELPKTCRFYIAKEYIEKKGPIEFLAQAEKRQNEASHKLSSAFLFAQAEMQKPFEQIDFESLQQKFNELGKDFHDVWDIAEKVKEAHSLFQDVYVQKKIAFLESKAERTPKQMDLDSALQERLAKLGVNLPSVKEQSKPDKNLEEIGKLASNTMGLSTTIGEVEITDKMLLWQPLEESVYHLWAAANDEKGMDEFYEIEQENAISITGIIEPYNRPVKNRPGDFILRSDSAPVAFLYSTRINLQKLSGKKATLVVSPRPNNNFAFPAYYVLSIE